MRQPTDEELKAIALLMQQSQPQRELAQSQKRAIIALGQQLPVIHQVLFQ